jgi:biopolymer transport protein ExbD
MKFRKKHKQESEVFTDSLNDILFILLMFFLIVATLANPNVIKVGLPRGTKDTKAKQNIMVSINKEQQYFIGTSPVDKTMLDSMLHLAIMKYRVNITDTPTIVISADTIAYVGEMFTIMRLAKKYGAKTTASVK